ncbi:MAG: hypothetical protein KUG78_21725 [Kangiellaceae bacterium]|nr:hypothetical protein [Kangiellaceae bacterium]
MLMQPPSLVSEATNFTSPHAEHRMMHADGSNNQDSDAESCCDSTQCSMSSCSYSVVLGQLPSVTQRLDIQNFAQSIVPVPHRTTSTLYRPPIS